MIRTRTDSALKIWSKDGINRFEKLPEEQEEFVIIQIEYAYDNLFMVEIIRKSDLHDPAIAVAYPPADMNIYPVRYGDKNEVKHSTETLADVYPTLYGNRKE